MHGLRIRLGGCAAPGPEGMFRTGESFDYLECEPCGSLRIDEVPADLSRHYESDPDPRVADGGCPEMVIGALADLR